MTRKFSSLNILAMEEMAVRAAESKDGSLLNELLMELKHRSSSRAIDLARIIEHAIAGRMVKIGARSFPTPSKGIAPSITGFKRPEIRVNHPKFEPEPIPHQLQASDYSSWCAARLLAREKCLLKESKDLDTSISLEKTRFQLITSRFADLSNEFQRYLEQKMPWLSEPSTPTSDRLSRARELGKRGSNQLLSAR